MSLPYTFTRLYKEIDLWATWGFRKTRLTKTLGNLPLHVMEIEFPMEEDEFLKNLDLPEHCMRRFIPRRARVTTVLILCRQHPGETVGSWVCEGLVKEIIKQKPKGLKFCIVPMVNPDGVTWGNSRCGLQGGDLNRSWGGPERKFPEI